MTTFDPTKPYSLRNGRKCEVHKLAEATSAGWLYVGSYQDSDGHTYVTKWDAGGHFYDGSEDDRDLVNTPPKPKAEKRWIVWYRNRKSGEVWQLAPYSSEGSAAVGASNISDSQFLLATTEQYAPGPGTRTVWVNVYPGNIDLSAFSSKENADRYASPDRIACVPVVIPTEGA